MSIPRLRYAISTERPPDLSELHLAALTWAWARALNGDLILHIQDAAGGKAEAASIDALNWLKLDWDEGPDTGGDFGPYRQSQRKARYQAIINSLLAANRAYTEADGTQVRLHWQQDGETAVPDMVRGDIRLAHDLWPEAPLLVAETGRFHPALLNAIDDHDMQISHVVSSEAAITHVALQIQLCQALDWETPAWLLLPMLHADSSAATLPTANDLQQEGYLPQAVLNYLLLCSWTPATGQEIVDRWQIRQQFQLAQLNPLPATFAWAELRRINRHYLGRMSDRELATAVRPFLEELYGELPIASDWLLRLTGAIKPNLATLADAVDQAEWAFSDAFAVSPAANALLQEPTARLICKYMIAEIAAVVLLDSKTAAAILAQLPTQMAAHTDWPSSKLHAPIYAALTGMTSGPPLAKIMGILGKAACLARLGTPLTTV